MKLDYKTALLVSSLLFGSHAPAIAQGSGAKPPLPQVEAGGGAGQKLAPSDVMAVIDGKPMTVGEVDQWSRFLVPQGEGDAFARRLVTLRTLVTLKAFSNAALAEKLDGSPDFNQRMELMRESTLQQLYVAKQFEKPVPEAEIKARYDKEIGSMPSEPEIHARHILVKTEAEAKALIVRLGKGESFEALAKEASTDGSASLGGDLGYFTKGQMVKPFEDAAFALKAGTYSKTPVETPFGWHIIKVEEVRMKEPPSYEESKSYIQNMLANERYEELQQKVVAGLKVTYPDEAVAKAMQKPLADEEGAEGFE